MEINNPAPLPQLPTLTLSPAAIKSWQAGQILNALVIKVTPQGLMTLQIGDTSIQANGSQLNPAPGQMLKLEVIRTEPQTVLKVTNPPVPAQTLTETFTEALKVLLPRQMALPPLLANLAFLASDDGRSLPALPHNIAVLIKKLIGDLPTDKKLSNADGFKRALSQSGMFLESKLTGSGNAGESSSIDQDLKANLLRLLANLQQTSPSTPSRNLPPNLPVQPSGPQLTAPKQASSEYAWPGSTAQNPDANPNVNPSARPNVNPNASPSLNPSTNPGVNVNTNPNASLTINPVTYPGTNTGTNTNPNANPTGYSHEVAQLPARQAAAPLMPQSPLQSQERADASVSGQQSPSQIIEELAQQVKGAIARLQIHQVSSLPTEDNPYPALSFELPLQFENHLDLMQVRIYQDRTSKTAEIPERWSASLAMEMESLGAVYATVTISQRQVWTTLWAEHKSTADIVNQHLQELYKGYNRAGLDAGMTHCNHGTPPLSVKNSHKVLVDTHA
ncbi:MAG TPA: flagellar hook-length control protein FliK [Gammaproteobacteria bacterium]